MIVWPLTVGSSLLVLLDLSAIFNTVEHAVGANRFTPIWSCKWGVVFSSVLVPVLSITHAFLRQYHWKAQHIHCYAATQL